MKVTLWFSCTVMISFFYLLKSEECTDPENIMHDNILEQVTVGQPHGVGCSLHKPLPLKSENYNLTWYRNGSKIPITKNTQSRIHQHKNILWFLPANVQDTGLYECVVCYKNSTRCSKTNVPVNVFKHSGDPCFDAFFYRERIIISQNAKIVCPNMQYFREEMHDLYIHWYKDCKPLKTNEWYNNKGDFIVPNVNENDAGKYRCNASYLYMGKQYNVSRSIFVCAEVNPKKKTTEILYPTNNTIEAELGSNVFVECNVSHSQNSLLSISWKVNNTLVAYAKGRVQEGDQVDFDTDEGMLSTVPLNITKLKEEDYGSNFVCHAGETAAYFLIQRPTKHIMGYVIGGIVALLFIIVVAALIFTLFRIDIVLWYRKSCHPFLHKQVSDGKIYDAYVLYPKICIPDCFVLKALPEVLEKQCGYTLFIFGRDDLPGKAVVSLIDESIKQSRRLIIILVSGSSSYTLLEEGPEQQIAMYNALIRDGMKVILIEMDKIKDYSNMPESIKYIKQKHGAIRWEGDLTKRQSYSASTKFWKRVRYQMPPGQRTSPQFPLVPTSISTCQIIER